MDCDLKDFSDRRLYPSLRELGHLLLVPSACLGGFQISAGRPGGDSQDLAGVPIDKQIRTLKAFLLLLPPCDGCYANSQSRAMVPDKQEA